MKHLIFPLVLVLFTLQSVGQKFEYSVLFEGIGDNREFSSEKAASYTILGSRGAFEVGTTIGEHKLRAGLSELYEFGSEIDAQQPKLILYYQIDKEKTQFYFGAFPRRDLINFPLAMLSDTLLYYRPNIEGMYGQHEWSWGRQNAFIDWTSRQTDYDRETFLAGTSGEMYLGPFTLENYVLMYHYAGPGIAIPDDHVIDYNGYSVMGAYTLNEREFFNAKFSAGVLGSAYRERGVSDGFNSSLSFIAKLDMSYKSLAVNSTLHSGDGHNFPMGDWFYRQKNYWRTDLIWNFVQHKNVTGRFNYSLHYVNNDRMDVSQQLSIVYRFDGK